MSINWVKLHEYLVSKCSAESIKGWSIEQDVVAFGYLFHKICAYLGWQSDPDQIGNYHQLYIQRVKTVDNILTGLYLLGGGNSPTRYLEILHQQHLIIHQSKETMK